jgi:deoxyribonuclease V
VGSVVRTRARVQPVFVSPGHRIDLESAVRWVLAACRRYRLPEPTRLAHLYVNEVRTGGG